MGYKVITVDQETRDKFQAREALEGPFFYDGNRVLYYDNKEGKYLNPRTDMFLSYDEYVAYTQ